jgi:class 3 adenylate cyclase/tetratricopeptide (TPR) repeat protein
VAAKFCSACGARLEEGGAASRAPAIAETTSDQLAALRRQAPVALQEKMRRAQAGMEGERKPVTILFTDIVGSTALAEKLDPEDWREIVRGAHRLVSGAVYHYEGAIAQLLGDGVLAFFGAPITHEDDPLRAVQAALDIQEAMRGYAAGLPRSVPDFKLRVGINTGTVVVGNIGDDLHMEYLAIGDAVNLAARLQSAAEPGGILLSGETALSLRQAVLLKDLGEIAVKGKQEPVQTYQVMGLKDLRGHGRKLAETGKSRLVGRQAEMETLLKASAAVKAGLGRAVVIIGEPGLGKTRLLVEWKERDSAQSSSRALRWVAGECLSYGQELPYHLIGSWLRSLLTLPGNASEGEIHAALMRLCQDLFGEARRESYAFLAHLLSLALPEEAAQYLHGMNPQGFQAQYIATLQQVLLALAQDQPLALVFEDIHWADPSSVAILCQLLPLAKAAPLLFCFIGRPEPNTPGWGLVEASHTTMGGGLVEIMLQSLAEAEVQELAAAILGDETLPQAVQKLVTERAEGNPLFVEELVSLLVEKGALVREAGGLRASGELAAIQLPENLVRLMLARIDRLPEEPKRTLRVASVIGRQFLLPTLKDVLQRIGQAETQPRLLSQLGELEFASLVQLATTHPELTYLFRHALVQEAAYQAVLKADRRWVHRATAEALESAYPERLDELAPTLAYHYERGEAHHKALVYLERAGDRADKTYANAEALALYRSAIEQADQMKVENLPGCDPIQGVQLRMKLGDILVRVGQHETARAVYEEALTALPEDEHSWRARLWDHIGNAWIIPRRFDQAIVAYQAAETALGGMPEESNPELFNQWIDLQLDYISAYYWMNDVANMQAILERLAVVIESSGTALQRATYYFHLVEMEFRRDRYWIGEASMEHLHTSLAAAHESGDLSMICMITFGLGFAHLWRMELDQAENDLAEALALADRIGDTQMVVLCSTYSTVVYWKKKAIEAVKEWATRALKLAGEAHMSFYEGIALGNLAWASYTEGNLAQAEEYIRQAQATALSVAPMPMRILYLWPLLAIQLRHGQMDEAVEAARGIIHPSQARIPDDLEAILREGIERHAEGKADESKERLDSAVKMAIEVHYF